MLIRQPISVIISGLLTGNPGNIDSVNRLYVKLPPPPSTDRQS